MLSSLTLQAHLCWRTENGSRKQLKLRAHRLHPTSLPAIRGLNRAFQRSATNYRPVSPRAAPKNTQSEEDAEDPFAALMQAARDAGARVEPEREDESGVWDDDYLEIVADGDDPWGRAAFDPENGPHSEGLEILPAIPASPSAYAAEGGFRDVAAAELAAMCSSSDPPVVIDLRSEAEFAEGHVQRATSVPFDRLSDTVKAGALDYARSRTVVLVCAAGSKAAQGAVRLQKVFGFAEAIALRGGMLSYLAAALPLEKGGATGGGNAGAQN